MKSFVRWSYLTVKGEKPKLWANLLIAGAIILALMA